MILFCATADPRIDAILDSIKEYVNYKTSPDSILLLGLESEREKLKKIEEDNRIKDTLPEYTRSNITPLVHVDFVPRKGLNDDDKLRDFTWRELRTAGLESIFLKRDALMVAPSTHHFEKPSKLHCDRFIRTANSLVDGAEITFIATCCLKFIPDTVHHFYCDTGGINVIAFAIDSIRRRFDQGILAATVDTFESYAGLKSFRFQDVHDSIILISASTSGGLEKKLREINGRINLNGIITIFSVGHSNNGTHTLLDINDSKELRDRIRDLQSHKQDECPLCRKGSIPVPMIGDQFIPGKATTRTVLPGKIHKPLWLDRVVKSMAGKQILRAFYRCEDSKHATDDIFIDLERAFSGNWDTDFLKRLYRIIDQVVPARVRRIIHLDDSASKLLANKVNEYVFKDEPKRYHVVQSAKETQTTEPMKDGSCLVVASAVASGQSLLSISQRLRSLQENGAITYLVALTRYDNDSRKKKIETDITMGELPNEYGFTAVERIFLPVAGRLAKSSWSEELELLNEFANTAQGDLSILLESRIEVLRDAQSPKTRGLSNKLFWTNSRGDDLKVRPGYVFFPAGEAVDYSQGDVYFTIVSVLHQLRTFGSKPDLRQTEYERCLLSPHCFDRFNDGAIQASILRAAIRPELDYSLSPEESLLMTNILKSIFGNYCNEKGEASREFILALALGRLVLCDSDLADLHKDFSSTTNDLIIKRLWRHICESRLPK